MDSKHQGFSLEGVCLGYRDIFATALDRLYNDGHLGPHRAKATQILLSALCSGQGRGPAYEDVLMELLMAMSPHTLWLLDHPDLLDKALALGMDLASPQPLRAMDYFRLLGEGALGNTPSRVSYGLEALKRLYFHDQDLALALLRGYRSIAMRLRPAEMDQYIHQALRLRHRNPEAVIRFLEGSVKGSEAAIRALTGECRLSEVRHELFRLVQPLVGMEVELRPLEDLPPEDLASRLPSVVCFQGAIYLPALMRRFPTTAMNRNWYKLQALTAAACLVDGSFCRIHGLGRYRTCQDVVGCHPLRVNLFQILETLRILGPMHARWPGARGLLALGRREYHPHHPPDALLSLLMGGSQDIPEAARPLMEAAQGAKSLFDAAAALDQPWVGDLAAAWPGLDCSPLRLPAFMPDFLFPAPLTGGDEILLPGLLKLLGAPLQEGMKGQALPVPPEEGEEEGKGEEDAGPDEEAYFYDEWSQGDDDYHRGHCRLREHRPGDDPRRPLPDELLTEVKAVRRAFELLRPEMIRRDKYLGDGDSINHDLLVRHLVARHREPEPRIDFYEKGRIKRRDLAVIVLLDVSGSTDLDAGRERIIVLEQHAALILGQGLSVLGDRFAVSGFSGKGRLGCEYFIYKDFAQPWDEGAIGAVLASRPLSATRMGPALRHSAFLLSRQEARTRLVIMVTDGKPRDGGYDPTTRYAQHDVRMACEEARRQGIVTFCVSTDENTREDMELMFPDGRFAILESIGCLPHILPRLYLKITT